KKCTIIPVNIRNFTPRAHPPTAKPNFNPNSTFPPEMEKPIPIHTNLHFNVPRVGCNLISSRNINPCRNNLLPSSFHFDITTSTQQKCTQQQSVLSEKLRTLPHMS
ncbi:hypothetical protein M758_4G049500, partial [Ceratodon purpureus]